MPVHTIPPVFDQNSRILILGSFPSVKSRESAFFYGHPQNRFWRMLAAVYHTVTPFSTEEKISLLLKHHLALWDVIAECSISGSADASIKDAVPNDVSRILSAAPINKIIVNGKTAEKYYKHFLLPQTGIQAVALPSTSPANARISFNELVAAWQQALQ